MYTQAAAAHKGHSNEAVPPPSQLTQNMGPPAALVHSSTPMPLERRFYTTTVGVSNVWNAQNFCSGSFKDKVEPQDEKGQWHSGSLRSPADVELA